MKIIGYWHDPDDESTRRFPDPRDLVDFKWLEEEKHKLVSYLRAAQTLCGQWGYSWCRFECGIPEKEMGSREFTDGHWVWPEGLAHYVEHHGVVLPEDFIDHARANAWITPPADLTWEPIKNRDSAFWLEWTDRVKAERAAVPSPQPRSTDQGQPPADTNARQRMTREEAVEVARAFIATQPKDWRQEWPTKRFAVKRVLSRHTNEEVWQVRSQRDGLDRSNISVEVSPQTGAVSYAEKGGGLREERQEYFPTKSSFDD